MTGDDIQASADWWSTAITRIEPGVIEHRGRPVQDLIGTTTVPEMIWLMLRGEKPDPAHAKLLEVALVSATDHGPQAPSIAIARMAATCGVGLNSAIASAVNVLGDIHGGAGEQCLELLESCLLKVGGGSTCQAVAEALVSRYRTERRPLPGFGHRFHPRDPRRDPILRLVQEAVDGGAVAGEHLAMGLALEAALAHPNRPAPPMNVDGATAIVFGELGFPPPLARGVFVLSRSIGILAHAWEETQAGSRLKGPLPPEILPTYSG